MENTARLTMHQVRKRLFEAEQRRISSRQLRRLAAAGELGRPVKANGYWRFTEAAVEKLIEKRAR
jgi:predicted site-specific integrase-resolvase